MFQFIQTAFSALLNSWNTHMLHLWPPLILLSSHSVEGNDWVSAIQKHAYFRFPGPPSFPPCSIHSNMLLSTICHDGASFIQSDKVNCSLEEDASLICCIQAFQTPLIYLGFRFAAVAAHVFHGRGLSSRLESKNKSEVQTWGCENKPFLGFVMLNWVIRCLDCWITGIDPNIAGLFLYLQINNPA